IFNRWGVLVYEKEGYTNSEPFRGYSNGRSTIERGKKLPQGTYYYILEYENSHNQTQTKSGWLYLKTE
ncbi:T9SS type B sorting domain-containing protein, partial [Capnocytophaga gingivalis]